MFYTRTVAENQKYQLLLVGIFMKRNYLIFVSVRFIWGGACSGPKFTASVDRKLI